MAWKLFWKLLKRRDRYEEVYLQIQYGLVLAKPPSILHLDNDKEKADKLTVGAFPLQICAKLLRYFINVDKVLRDDAVSI